MKPELVKKHSPHLTKFLLKNNSYNSYMKARIQIPFNYYLVVYLDEKETVSPI